MAHKENQSAFSLMSCKAWAKSVSGKTSSPCKLMNFHKNLHVLYYFKWFGVNTIVDVRDAPHPAG